MTVIASGASNTFHRTSAIKYYLVGGYVRDRFLIIKNKDIDFAVEAPSYEAMRDDLLSRGIEIFIERPEYYSIRGRHPKYGGVDFTLCRKDGYYSDNRHPDNVSTGRLADDLARRDFTVNAMAVGTNSDLEEETPATLFDPFGGLDDIKNRVLRCVGDPEERFSEDALRLLRAVRFHIVRNFVLDSTIEDAFENPKLVEKLRDISKERIYEELKKCFEHDSFRTLMFFKYHDMLEIFLFGFLEIGLLPRIPQVLLSKSQLVYQSKLQ